MSTAHAIQWGCEGVTTALAAAAGRGQYRVLKCNRTNRAPDCDFFFACHQTALLNTIITVALKGVRMVVVEMD